MTSARQQLEEEEDEVLHGDSSAMPPLAIASPQSTTWPLTLSAAATTIRHSHTPLHHIDRTSPHSTAARSLPAPMPAIVQPVGERHQVTASICHSIIVKHRSITVHAKEEHHLDEVLTRRTTRLGLHDIHQSTPLYLNLPAFHQWLSSG